MPGIYVNDGGGLQSSLGQVLGQIATTVGPKSAAEAALLQQQTQGADLANERNWSQQVLDAAAARNAGGILATGGADAQPPGSVASTAASLARPPASIVGPGGRYPLVDPTGMTPNQTYMAGRLFTGMSPSDLTTAINLGRNETTGPGTDFATGNAIAQAQGTPQHVAAGDTLVIDPRKGNAPGNVIVGGDPAALAAQTEALKNTTTEAQAAFDRGKQAISDDAELADISKGYDALINIPDGDITIPGVLEGLKAATAATGGKFDFTRFSSKQEAINDLTARMQSMLGSARALGGDPAMRGSIEYLTRGLNVAGNTAPSFHRMVDVFHRQLQNLQDEGAASDPFLRAPTSAGAATLRDTLIANRQRRADELRSQGFSADAAGGSGGGKRWRYNPETGRTEPQ